MQRLIADADLENLIGSNVEIVHAKAGNNYYSKVVVVGQSFKPFVHFGHLAHHLCEKFPRAGRAKTNHLEFPQILLLVGI